jgi:hypothetical protein
VPQDFTSQAKAFPPFFESLDPRGNLSLPARDKINEGNVDDLVNSYAAILPSAMKHLSQVGDRFVGGSVIGDFSQKPDFGQDCIQPVYELTALNSTEATVSTSFLPPAQKCAGFDYKKDFEMEPVVSGSINNIQMIQGATGQKIVMWGQERIFMKTVIDVRTGIILSSTMDNPLILKMRLGCDDHLENCANRVDHFEIHRQVNLKLKH